MVEILIREDMIRQLDAKYGESCPLCGSRIDQRGLCACGAGGG